MTLRLALLLVAVVLLTPRFAWADAAGVQLYESGEYEAAVQSFTQVLADAKSSARQRGEARLYLAASLHAMGQAEEARRQLEALAREHSELRVDAVRFPPDLVALAEAIRQQVETEQAFARREAEREREARAEALRRLPAPAYLRPEAVGLFEALGFQWSGGGGIAYHQGRLEGGARVLLGSDPSVVPAAFFPTFQLQGGWLLSAEGVQPLLGARAILTPATGSYGAGAVAGARIPLTGGLRAVVELGAEYFFLPADEDHLRFAVTAQVGLGFDVLLPRGR
jgi:tetratricopeptide (TPR) repeat protein